MTDKAQFSSVFFRKYIFQFIILLLSLVFLTVLSLSICQSATESYAERERYRSAELNEVIFSLSPGYSESFYSFGGSAYAFTEDGHRINTDVMMTVDGNEYIENPLYFKSMLPEGRCAVSENLAAEFSLSEGERVSIKVGNESLFDFTVIEILPAQSGVDGKYMHEGVIILSENMDLVNAGKHIFISFAKDWEAEYVDLVDDPARGKPVVYTKELIKSESTSLMIYAIASTLSLWVFIGLCEILIFSKMGRKYRDYSILSGYGISRKRLFLKVLFDNCIKYIIPLLINFLIWFIRLSYYHSKYMAPALFFLGTGALTVLMLTFITVMRKNRCLKIRR